MSFFFGHWNTGTNPDLAFASVGYKNDSRQLIAGQTHAREVPKVLTPTLTHYSP